MDEKITMTAEYTFDLQYLFDCYPIRKRLVKFFKSTDLYVLQFVVHNAPKHYAKRNTLMRKWAERGCLGVMKWARAMGCPLSPNSYHGAARAGRVDIMEWLYSHNVKIDRETLKYAIMGGHYRVLYWLKNHGVRFVNGCSGIEHALINDHDDMIKWLHAQGCGIECEEFFEAARLGRKDILDWLCARHGHMDGFAADGAAFAGNLELLKYIFSRLSEKEKRSCSIHSNAVLSGQLHVVKWVFEHFNTDGWADGEVDLGEDAAAIGNIEVLEWLYEHHADKCEFGKNAMVGAVVGRNKHVIDWLLEREPVKCAMNEDLFEKVAYQHDLPALKYLYKLGCPWDARVTEIACWNKKRLDWLVKKGCPYNKYACDKKRRRMMDAILRD
jgi:hypothetical protein